MARRGRVVVIVAGATLLAACSLIESFDGLVQPHSADAAVTDATTSVADAAADGNAGRFCDGIKDAVLCVDFDQPDASAADLGDPRIDRPDVFQGSYDDDGGPVGTLGIVADKDAPSGPNVLRATFDQFAARYLYDARTVNALAAGSAITLSFALRIDSAAFPSSGAATTMQLALVDLRGPIPVNGDTAYGNALSLILAPTGELRFQKSNVHDFPYVDLVAPAQPGLRVFFDVAMTIDLRGGAGTPRFAYSINGQPAGASVDASVFDAGVTYSGSDFTLGLRDYGFATTVGLVTSYDNVVVRLSP